MVWKSQLRYTRFGKACVQKPSLEKLGFQNQVWKSLVAMAGGQYPPNKWGYQGFNCKRRLCSSGTTHAIKGENTLQKQLTALEKAAEKAQQRLKEMQEKKEEEEEENSYSYYSPTPRKASKKGKSKARSVAASLEKERPRSVSGRRVRFAKNGQKEEVLEVKEEPETAEQALGKATSSAASGSKQKKALEKAPVVPEESKKEQALEKAPVVPVEGNKKEALEKAFVASPWPSLHMTWSKVGWNGKAAWCEWLNAEAIFDDD